MIFVAFEFVGVAVKSKDKSLIPGCFASNLQSLWLNFQVKLIHLSSLIAKLFCDLTDWNKLTLHLCGIEIQYKVVIS